MTLMQNKKRYYKRDKAMAIAFELNNDEQTEDNPEVWRFIVRDCLRTLAFIEVYDHENEFVGYWDL